jgi:hypothetical protein
VGTFAVIEDYASPSVSMNQAMDLQDGGTIASVECVLVAEHQANQYTWANAQYFLHPYPASVPSHDPFVKQAVR